jgi:hypothetical protein
MTTDDEIRVLLDTQAITDALHRYCYSRDTGDLEMGLAVSHPDGTARYEGLFEGSFRDFLAAPTYPGSSHSLSNVLVEVDGDRATSRSCVTSASSNVEAARLFIMRGRFTDTWSRRDGTWAIDHREFTIDSTEIATLNVDGIPSAPD